MSPIHAQTCEETYKSPENWISSLPFLFLRHLQIKQRVDKIKKVRAKRRKQYYIRVGVLLVHFTSIIRIVQSFPLLWPNCNEIPSSAGRCRGKYYYYYNIMHAGTAINIVGDLSRPPTRRSCKSSSLGYSNSVSNGHHSGTSIINMRYGRGSGTGCPF